MANNPYERLNKQMHSVRQGSPRSQLAMMLQANQQYDPNSAVGNAMLERRNPGRRTVPYQKMLPSALSNRQPFAKTGKQRAYVPENIGNLDATTQALGKATVTNHEYEHAFDQRSNMRNAELAPSFGDLAFSAENYRQQTGDRLTDPIKINGVEQSPEWIRSQANQHGYFQGRSMQSLLETPAGRSYIKRMASPIRKPRPAMPYDEAPPVDRMDGPAEIPKAMANVNSPAPPQTYNGDVQTAPLEGIEPMADPRTAYNPYGTYPQASARRRAKVGGNPLSGYPAAPAAPRMQAGALNTPLDRQITNRLKRMGSGAALQTRIAGQKVQDVARAGVAGAARATAANLPAMSRDVAQVRDAVALRTANAIPPMSRAAAQGLRQGAVGAVNAVGAARNAVDAVAQNSIAQPMPMDRSYSPPGGASVPLGRATPQGAGAGRGVVPLGRATPQGAGAGRGVVPLGLSEPLPNSTAVDGMSGAGQAKTPSFNKIANRDYMWNEHAAVPGGVNDARQRNAQIDARKSAAIDDMNSAVAGLRNQAQAQMLQPNQSAPQSAAMQSWMASAGNRNADIGLVGRSPSRPGYTMPGGMASLPGDTAGTGPIQRKSSFQPVPDMENEYLTRTTEPDGTIRVVGKNRDSTQIIPTGNQLGYRFRDSDGTRRTVSNREMTRSRMNKDNLNKFDSYLDRRATRRKDALAKRAAANALPMRQTGQQIGAVATPNVGPFGVTANTQPLYNNRPGVNLATGVAMAEGKIPYGVIPGATTNSRYGNSRGQDTPLYYGQQPGNPMDARMTGELRQQGLQMIEQAAALQGTNPEIAAQLMSQGMQAVNPGGTAQTYAASPKIQRQQEKRELVEGQQSRNVLQADMEQDPTVLDTLMTFDDPAGHLADSGITEPDHLKQLIELRFGSGIMENENLWQTVDQMPQEDQQLLLSTAELMAGMGDENAVEFAESIRQRMEYLDNAEQGVYPSLPAPPSPRGTGRVGIGTRRY